MPDEQPGDGGFTNPETSKTIEEAYAKFRARVVTFDNGITITEGELEDMTPEQRRAFFVMANQPKGDT